MADLLDRLVRGELEVLLDPALPLHLLAQPSPALWAKCRLVSAKRILGYAVQAVPYETALSEVEAWLGQVPHTDEVRAVGRLVVDSYRQHPRGLVHNLSILIGRLADASKGRLRPNACRLHLAEFVMARHQVPNAAFLRQVSQALRGFGVD